MKQRIFLLFFLIGIGGIVHGARLKDLVTIGGNRDNQLVGYGLVVGLNGKGDGKADYTAQGLANSLNYFGIHVSSDKVESKNVAAVMVTANIGPSAKEGTRMDVTVSSIGGAQTLQGGILLQTPLKGADGVVYAVAQGPVTLGGFLAGDSSKAGGASVQQNHTTVGRVVGGAIIEREIKCQVVQNGSVNVILHNPDFTSAVRVADAINKVFGGAAQATDMGTVNVHVPRRYSRQEVNFIARLGEIEVIPDTSARVIVNERTGTIVATSNVRLSSVAISHGPLTITIASQMAVSQPNSFTGNSTNYASQQSDTSLSSNQNTAVSGADNTGTSLNKQSFGGQTINQGASGVHTQVLESMQVVVDDKAGNFTVIPEYPTIERLASALNAMGVTTRDMISILQNMKTAGALQADLVFN